MPLVHRRGDWRTWCAASFVTASLFACTGGNGVSDAADAAVDTAIADHGPVLDFPVLVRDIAGPLAGAHVRAERASGVFVEAVTDESGTAHLAIDPARGPMDITIAAVGYGAISVLGVDEPLPSPVTLIRRLGLPPRGMSITGVVHGRTSDASGVLVHAVHMRESTLVGPGIEDLDWISSYTPNAPGMPLSLPPLRLIAIESDRTGRILNAGVSPDIERSGRPIAGADVTLSSPPRPVRHATGTIEWAGDGMLTADNAIGSPRTGVWKWSGYDQFWFVGALRVTPPLGEVSRWEADYFDGDIAPSGMLMSFDLGQPAGSALFVLRREPPPTGDIVRLPVVRALGLGGTCLGEIEFRADARDVRGLWFGINDGTPPSVWTGWVLHPERDRDLHMPHLPSAVPITQLSDRDLTIVAGLELGGPALDPFIPGLSIGDFPLVGEVTVATPQVSVQLECQ